MFQDEEITAGRSLVSFQAFVKAMGPRLRNVSRVRQNRGAHVMLRITGQQNETAAAAALSRKDRMRNLKSGTV